MISILNKRPESFSSHQAAIEWAIDSSMCRCRRAAAISMPGQLIEREGRFHWRTPLAKSEPYWLGWYEGLSDAFLSVKVPKMLVLAGSDRLDKSLTIAQMQGKFQMVLVPNAGHAVHEDDAEKMAETLSTFIKRFRVGKPPMLFPKAPPGIPVALPQVAGPLHEAEKS
jgi:protein phosphatase methylesterase 1